mgnify:FL=1
MVSRAEKTKIIKEKYSSGEQKSRRAMQEFGPGERGFTFCPYGEAIYYKKSWHHMGKFFRNPPNTENKSLKFKLCPAHQMQKNKQYEGEVIIKNVPAEFRKELLNLIENMGERAMRRDVLDRILTLQVAGYTIRVFTSENQLAQRIANKIGEVFKKKVKIDTSRAKGGDVVRLRANFLQ